LWVLLGCCFSYFGFGIVFVYDTFFSLTRFIGLLEGGGVSLMRKCGEQGRGLIICQCHVLIKIELR
jgi:hypothetical protein